MGLFLSKKISAGTLSRRAKQGPLLEPPRGRPTRFTQVPRPNLARGGAGLGRGPRPSLRSPLWAGDLGAEAAVPGPGLIAGCRVRRWLSNSHHTLGASVAPLSRWGNGDTRTSRAPSRQGDSEAGRPERPSMCAYGPSRGSTASFKPEPSPQRRATGTARRGQAQKVGRGSRSPRSARPERPPQALGDSAGRAPA